MYLHKKDIKKILKSLGIELELIIDNTLWLTDYKGASGIYAYSGEYIDTIQLCRIAMNFEIFKQKYHATKTKETYEN